MIQSLLGLFTIVITISSAYEYIECYQDHDATSLRYGPRDYGYTIDSCAQQSKQKIFGHF